MLVIGLTGGIGSGKSTVTRLFERFNITVIDTDCIAHEIVQPHTMPLKKISDHFGSTFITDQGELKRSKLRNYIFNHPSERRWLEQLMHPLIKKTMLERIQQAKEPYCLCVIPLLVEQQLFDHLQRIVVVDAPLELQIQRAMGRDHATQDEITAILKTQTSRENRLKVADDIIINNQDHRHLEQQVSKLHRKYIELANGLNKETPCA